LPLQLLLLPELSPNILATNGVAVDVVTVPLFVIVSELPLLSTIVALCNVSIDVLVIAVSDTVKVQNLKYIMQYLLLHEH
jgi:hypothetical protein